MAAITVRAFTKNDEAAMVMLIAQHQDFHRALEPQWPAGSNIANEYLEYLFEECDEYDGRILLAFDDPTVAGFICVVSDKRGAPDDPTRYAYVHDLFVAPAYRRRGIAKILMGAAEEFANSRGVSELRLTVLERNSDARAFYAALGFRGYARILTKRKNA